MWAWESRVLESTTGWKTEAECKCFECNNMTCVPSQETKPENGIDGDGITALGTDAAKVISQRRAPTVLTPHDGEFERLAGSRPGPDRFAACRDDDVGDVQLATHAGGRALGPRDRRQRGRGLCARRGVGARSPLGDRVPAPSSGRPAWPASGGWP